MARIVSDVDVLAFTNSGLPIRCKSARERGTLVNHIARAGLYCRTYRWDESLWLVYVYDHPVKPFDRADRRRKPVAPIGEAARAHRWYSVMNPPHGGGPINLSPRFVPSLRAFVLKYSDTLRVRVRPISESEMVSVSVTPVVRPELDGIWTIRKSL